MRNFNKNASWCRDCTKKQHTEWRNKHYVNKARPRKHSIKSIRSGVVHVKEWGYTVKVFSNKADARKWVKTQQLKNVRIKKPKENIDLKENKVVRIIKKGEEGCTEKLLPFTKLLD